MSKSLLISLSQINVLESFYRVAIENAGIVGVFLIFFYLFYRQWSKGEKQRTERMMTLLENQLDVVQRNTEAMIALKTFLEARNR